MWSKVWTWTKGNPLFALIIVLACILAVESVAAGIPARLAAQRYLDLAKGWATAYQRDTAATKVVYEGKIKALTADRDAYRKKYEAAKGKMGAPWTPPRNPKEIEERFLNMGYRGKIR